jgi:hypothetical protein
MMWSHLDRNELITHFQIQFLITFPFPFQYEFIVNPLWYHDLVFFVLIDIPLANTVGTRLNVLPIAMALPTLILYVDLATERCFKATSLT